MTEFNPPVHSISTLIKASVAASIIALVVLVAFVLPAEYGIDPTGLGKSLGLAQYAEVETKLENKAENKQEPTPSALDKPLTGFGAAVGSETATQEPMDEKSSGEHSQRSDRVDITIPAGKGLEYKLLMDKYAHLEYEWQTNGSELYFDFHGEPKGDTTGYFESFSITTSNKMKGSLTTPFAGSHGWYWKNRSDKPVVVTLKTKGIYTIKG